MGCRLFAFALAISITTVCGQAQQPGEFYGWGWGGWATLGNGQAFYDATPAQVSGLTGIIAIAAGGAFSAALRNDGTVWVWGDNLYGELGNGDTSIAYSITPVEVLGLTGITAISAGKYHVLALRNDGTVWAWGDNATGELGNGYETNSFTPVEVSGLGNVAAISAGYFFSMALLSDGAIVAWGRNAYGELGDGTFDRRLTPVAVTGLSGVTSIATGYDISLAVKSDGTVWSWGYNVFGSLGNGTTNLDGVATPVQVTGFTNGKGVGAGEQYSCALKNDGTIWGWGSNYDGATNTGINSTTAVQIAGFTGGAAISGGGYHTLVLKNDGSVWAFGYNGFGQLGNGTTTNSATAVQVPGLVGMTAVSAGEYHSLALSSTGTVWAWGWNGTSQLGSGTSQYAATPAAGTALDDIVGISAGGYHSLAVRNDGTAWAWGDNENGQLGIGTFQNTSTPVRIPSLSGVKTISAGAYHSLAITGGGTVWAWGDDTYGELGNGTTTEFIVGTDTPIEVPGMTNAIAIAAGESVSLAVNSNGTVWAWGYNDDGELGNGTTNQSDTPVQVPGLTGITSVAGGADFSLAVRNDGTVWAWGNNEYGQLGTGTYNSSLTPVQVVGLTGVIGVAAGYYHGLAVKTDGTVWGWGDGLNGQLGPVGQTQSYATTPLQITGIPNATAVAAAANGSLALTAGGQVWAWGDNTYAELGNGGFNSSSTPTQVTGIANAVAIAAGPYWGLASLTLSVPVLNITSSHSGSFTQGQQGAAYTLTVSNTGSAPTSGTVTVTDTIPSGLTLVSMGGTNWMCSGNTCTRSNALPAGSNYPAITVTVNVGANATSPQVNSASASGGGSASASTTDSTTITQTSVPAFFTGEVALGSGVYYLSFPDNSLFGYYAFTGGGWIDHFDMGYEYVDAGTGTNVYFWDLSTGHWWYTSATEFPYLYDFTLNAWLYYYPAPNNPGHYTSNPRYFVNLTTNQIFTM